MPETIHHWDKIKKDYNGSILVGNGASIAISDKFNYKNFYDLAAEKSDFNQIKEVFKLFKTHDFEFVLRKLLQTQDVNQRLEIPDSNKISKYYKVVQQALISAIQTVHPKHSEIESRLDSLYEFIKLFELIISLNYDLLIYWAVMYGKSKKDNCTIEDCFRYGKFNHDILTYKLAPESKEYNPLVCYPHGNLALAQDENEAESKIKSRFCNDLLDTIIIKWQRGYTPIFVSEGSEDQKKQAIARSQYLNAIFNNVLTTLPSDNLTIYGFGFNKQDLYILEQIAKSNKIKRVAVSVYNNNQDYCLEVKKILKNKLNIKDKNIQFFSSTSVGEWSSRRIKEVITIENKVTTH